MEPIKSRPSSSVYSWPMIASKMGPPSNCPALINYAAEVPGPSIRRLSGVGEATDFFNSLLMRGCGSGASTASQLEIPSQQLDTVQMDFRKDACVGANCCFQKSLPKARTIVPARSQFSSVPDRDAVDVRRGQLRDGTRYERGHPEYQAGRARPSTRGASGLRQNLANERRRAVCREQRNRRVRMDNTMALSNASPPIRAFEVYIQKQHWTATRTLTSLGAELLPQVLKSKHRAPGIARLRCARYLGKQLHAASVKSVRRCQHLPTGPPDLRRRAPP